MSCGAAAPTRLGVFGGAFDPPHMAHHAIVQAAIAQLRLDVVHIVPTGQAWHKTRELSPAADRIAMAELAFGDLPGVRVDRRETERAGPSFSIDTVRELLREVPQAALFLIVGQDQARSLTRWHAWQALLQSATICVAARQELVPDDDQFAAPPEVQRAFVALQIQASPVSASDIRRRVSSGQSVVPLVGAAVARYIAHHHLYQTA